MGIVKALCISERKGTEKHEVEEALFHVGHGIVGDAHAGNWHRQVSFLGLGENSAAGVRMWHWVPSGKMWWRRDSASRNCP